MIVILFQPRFSIVLSFIDIMLSSAPSNALPGNLQLRLIGNHKSEKSINTSAYGSPVWPLICRRSLSALEKA
jgi:hypothetical protein